MNEFEQGIQQIEKFAIENHLTELEKSIMIVAFIAEFTGYNDSDKAIKPNYSNY